MVRFSSCRWNIEKIEMNTAGGYLLLLATESIRGKKLPQNVENMINQTGFSFLFFLGMVLLVKDTFNLTR